jgi:diguanylate cyclase (GGDEF)-like protein
MTPDQGPVEGSFPDGDRAFSEGDQSSSDADQSSSDLDQTTSDSDQTSSDSDQLASDRDQRAADIDQAASDRAEGEGNYSPEYEETRRTRSLSALERDLSSQARSDASRIRTAAAERRDEDADARDTMAVERDELAAALDAKIDQLERSGPVGGDGDESAVEVLIGAVRDRKRAGTGRTRAAVQRYEASLDRTMALSDRRQAAADRDAAAEEVAEEGIDGLTGALRRRVGLAAMQRELARTKRSGEMLVVAFVDVDGLKAVNDNRGHAAGDELLREVTRCIKIGLRPYDIVTRYGGDEIICSLAGERMSGIRDRFDETSARIAESQVGATISVGLAERLGSEETLSHLIGRADAAMIAGRGTAH